MKSFSSMDEAYMYMASQLDKAQKCSPRNMEIKEILGASFELTNPRNRLIYIKERNSSLCFSVGEFLWYLSGSDKLDTIHYYSKMYTQFSDDKSTLHGAYGKRLFESSGLKPSQWSSIISLLRKDSDSRQAVIPIYSQQDVNVPSKDIPCTCILQYFIREGYLNCIVYMRSNDFYLGLPYDVFSFTLLQEMMANELGIELGTYKHFVGSLHVYERHYGVISTYNNWSITSDLPMDRMSPLDREQKKLLFKIEEKLRLNDDIDEESLSGLSHYWRQFIEILCVKASKYYHKSVDYSKLDRPYKIKLCLNE